MKIKQPYKNSENRLNGMTYIHLAHFCSIILKIYAMFASVCVALIRISVGYKSIYWEIKTKWTSRKNNQKVSWFSIPIVVAVSFTAKQLSVWTNFKFGQLFPYELWLGGIPFEIVSWLNENYNINHFIDR